MAIELEELLLPDEAAWRTWLAENHATHPGVRLVLHKKGGTLTELTYPQAVDQALCFGWIDGQRMSRDEHSFANRFTPRTKKSNWSAKNVETIARLTQAGLMAPAGFAVVEAAKADGRWEKAYAGQKDAQLPEDFLLIIRAMSLTSGVASNLDPAFNLWDSVEPYAGRLVRDERGSAVRDIAQEVLATAGVVARLPRRVDALITRAEEGRLAISTPRLDRRVARLERAVGRLATAMLFAGLLLAGALLRPDDPELGTALMVASAVPLVLVVVGPILGRRGPD